VVNGHKSAADRLIEIRQLAALITHTLAEVCIVLVLLVFIGLKSGRARDSCAQRLYRPYIISGCANRDQKVGRPPPRPIASVACEVFADES